MYVVGLLQLSHSQKMLLERRNIISVDMSQCPSVDGDHYRALEQFLEYLRLRRTDDNRLDWPSTGNDETTPNDKDDPVLCQNSAQPASTKELRISKSGSNSRTRTGYAATAHI